MDRKWKASRGEIPAELVLKNANILNVFTEEILTGDVAVMDGTIVGVGSYQGEQQIDCTGKTVVPGLIDAHMHIESSMVMPLELSRLLVKAGTTTLIADPHEIVNVKGEEALDFLLEATENLPQSVYVMIPSSVPATDQDTNGAGEFLAARMAKYASHPRVLGLGEVMRFEDVLHERPAIMEKLGLFRDKVADGHAPGITGKDVQTYRLAGIDNDHECSAVEEALEKARAGFHIFIREGSGARNLENLVKGFLGAGIPFGSCMFCTDDKHLEDIETEGHINYCVRKAISLGVSPVTAYRMATYQPAQVYGLKHKGAVAAGYDADLLILPDIREARPETVIQNGHIVTKEWLASFEGTQPSNSLLHTVKSNRIEREQLMLRREEKNSVIQMVSHELVTLHLQEAVPGEEFFTPTPEYNKLCVVERHGRNFQVGVAPIKNYGITGGAIATTVSHDSHNIIAAGDNDEDILLAVNKLRETQGGYVLAAGGKILEVLPLPVAGLISLEPGKAVQEQTGKMVRMAHEMGVNRDIDPFITLSFMALTVIPFVRLTEKGLVYC